MRNNMCKKWFSWLLIMAVIGSLCVGMSVEAEEEVKDEAVITDLEEGGGEDISVDVSGDIRSEEKASEDVVKMEQQVVSAGSEGVSAETGEDKGNQVASSEKQIEELASGGITEITLGERYKVSELKETYQGIEIKFLIEKDGRIKFNIENTKGNGNNEFSLYKYNANTMKYQLYGFSTSGLNAGIDMIKSDYITVPKGEYKCIFKQLSSYDTGDAELFVEYSALGEYVGEMENNDSYEDANSISVNTKYECNFFGGYPTEEKDYFKFELSKPGVVQVNIDANKTYIRFLDIYSEDSNGNLTKICYFSDYGTLMTSFSGWRVPAGKYYIILSGRDMEYNLTVNYREETLENFFEEEKNDYRSMANPGIVNQEYTGNLNDSDDRDFFSFTLPQDSNAALELRIPRQNQSGKCNVNLYKDSDTPVISASSTTNPYLISDPVELKAGTYYLCVSGSLDTDEQYQVKLKVILEQLPQISAKGYEGVYDGKGHSISVKAPTGTTVLYSLDDKEYTPKNPELKEVGEHTVYYKVTKPGYEEKKGSAKVVIKEAAFTGISVKGYAGIYDGKEHGLEVMLPSDTTITYSLDGKEYTEKKPVFKEIGKYTVYYKIEKKGYNTIIGSEEVSIRKLMPADILPIRYTGAYDGRPHSITINAPLGTRITYSTDGKEYTQTKPMFTDVGEYRVYYRAMRTEEEFIEGSEMVVIGKANLIITAYNIVKTTGDGPFNIGAKTNAGVLEFVSASPGIAQVDGNGQVTLGRGVVGRAVITISVSATQNYNAASKTITVTVNPKGTSLKTAKNVKGKKMTVIWKRNSSVTGYEVQYSTNKRFSSGVKKTVVSKNKTLKKSLSKLKKNKTYYVRIRTYKKTNGQKFYSSWSKAKKVKIKK